MLRMDRRSLLKGLVAAPLAKPLAAIAPAVAATPVAQPLDATLTALAAMNWTNERVILTHTGADTFRWVNVGDPTRW